MTVNGTVGCTGEFTQGYHVIYASIAFCFVISAQNVLAIATIYRHRALHTVTNLILVSLMIGDILTALTFLVVGITFYPGVITFSNDATLVNTFVLGCFSFTQILSCFHFGVAAIDRYVYIVRPFVYIKHVTKRLVMKVIIGCWLISVVNLWLPLIVFRSDYYKEICILISPPKAYFSVATCIHYTTMITMFICDFTIARLAFQRKKSANARRIEHAGGIALSENNYNAAIRSVKFLAVSFGTFSACTLPPNCFMWLSYLITLPHNVFVPLSYLFLANPVLRFYVHMYMSKDFYQCLKALLLQQRSRCC